MHNKDAPLRPSYRPSYGPSYGQLVKRVREARSWSAPDRSDGWHPSEKIRCRDQRHHGVASSL